MSEKSTFDKLLVNLVIFAVAILIVAILFGPGFKEEKSFGNSFTEVKTFSNGK